LAQLENPRRDENVFKPNGSPSPPPRRSHREKKSTKPSISGTLVFSKEKRKSESFVTNKGKRKRHDEDDEVPETTEPEDAQDFGEETPPYLRKRPRKTLLRTPSKHNGIT
jgi:hypothetical protein